MDIGKKIVSEGIVFIQVQDILKEPERIEAGNVVQTFQNVHSIVGNAKPVWEIMNIIHDFFQYPCIVVRFYDEMRVDDRNG